MTRLVMQAPAIVLVVGLSAAGALAAPPVALPNFHEINEHFIGPMPVVRTPWVDLTTHDGSGGWNFRITVDAQGHVAQAHPVWGPRVRREQAVQAVKVLQFKPFERDGRPVRVQFEQGVQNVVEDYVGPADRRFPSVVKPAQLRIALRRTACFGNCPDYWVEVRGDGQVSYRGFDYVVVKGAHRWKVAPEAVAALVERLRRADYFHLGGHYVTNVTDNPTYVTRVSLGPQKKFVLDYAGGMEMPPGFAPTDPAAPRMPQAVTDVEDAIDALSGVLSWTVGDEHTMARLREAHWNFRSQAAGRGLSKLVGDCKIALAIDFIRAGAPIQVKGKDAAGALIAAAHCGSTRLIRQLESKGALTRKQDARAFLESAVASGRPELVAIALTHDPDVRRKNSEGTPLLVLAANAIPRDDEGDAKPDPSAVIRQLIAAGADPDTRDKEGDSALHKVYDVAVARALLEAGANPNSRNADGQTPLFSGYLEEIIPVLAAAGADVGARDRWGRTALFKQRWPQCAQALLDAGADINASDAQG